MIRKFKKKRQTTDIKRIAKKYRTELMRNRTNAEKVFAYILVRLKVKFKEQYIVYPSKSFYIVDFYVPDHKIIFEIDGKQHYTQEGIKKDHKRDTSLATLGYSVKRFRNEEVYNPRKCERRIKDILGIKTNKFF